MKVLILNWRDPKNPLAGGAEIVTMHHARSWVKDGNSVTWFTSMYPKAKKTEVVDGVEIVRKGTKYTVFIYAALFYLSGGRSYDVVVDEIHGIPFFTPLFVKKPKLAFIHEVATTIWDYMFPFPMNVIGKTLERALLSFYKNVPFMTVSESTEKELSDFGIKEVVTIHNGLEAPIATSLPEKEKKYTFVFVSRIVRMKGIEDVIAAFQEIVHENKTAQLWIVGAGESSYLLSLQATIKKLTIEDHVTFFGKVSEEKKIDLLKRAHVLLHASIKEGWGLVVAEAASQGTPAVVYDVGGLRDSVKNNTTGIVLGQNSPKNMAEVALKLVKDKKRYRLFQENCLQWAKQLQWNDATKKSLILLKKVAKDA